MKWSPHQERIFSHIQNPDSGHAQIIARAGSGKTSTLVEGARRAPEAPSSILAVAFNKKIATELEERLLPGTVCRTFNALGHRTWAKYLGWENRVSLNTSKTFGLTKTHTTDLGQDAFSATMDLVRAAKSAGLVPDKVPQSHVTLLDDTDAEWEALADYFDIDFTSEIFFAARKVLIESIAASFRGEIDFDDQLYMPTLFGSPFDKFSLILVDEAQDLSLIQHKMLRKSLAKGGRVISVGDPAQAIYGFRGASAESMNMLENEFSPSVKLPLTTSFRCPQAVVREAQQDIPDIHPWEHAIEGEVKTLHEWSIEDIPRGSAILCRNNAPLFDLAWKAIREGIPVRMLGRDIGKGLTSLIKKLSGKANLEMDEFLARLEVWEEKETARKPKKEGITRDKAESLRGLSKDVKDSKALTTLIKSLFDPSGAVTFTLGSVHRSKGLEWPNVFILDRWRIPSKYASQPWQLEQEYNLRYVARTRAQKVLTYINMEDLE